MTESFERRLKMLTSRKHRILTSALVRTRAIDDEIARLWESVTDDKALVEDALRALTGDLLALLYGADPDPIALADSAREHQRQAAAAYVPGMRIDLDDLWARGRGGLFGALRRRGQWLEWRCPFTLDDLVARGFDLDSAMARLRARGKDGA